jgi:predicted transcriptional regulator
VRVTYSIDAIRLVKLLDSGKLTHADLSKVSSVILTEMREILAERRLQAADCIPARLRASVKELAAVNV